MALTFVGKESIPTYTCLSSDWDEGGTDQVLGAIMPGKTVFFTDTAVWKIILPDLTLAPYAIPASFSGTISLGEVSIDNSTPGTTNAVTIGASSAGTDGYGNYGAVISAPGSVNSAPLLSIPLGFNGATFDRQRIPTVFKDLAAVAITTIATVWTPAAGKKFRLMGGSISVSGVCSVLFEDNAAGTTIIRTPQLLANTPYSFELGNGILSGAINRILKATASTGTVTMTGHLYGVEE